ncbi:MAG: hypothetical protein IPL65_12310 [Lewinellaceae bacterium]|nr:hypothetical protein [Lewinellaceae bacterium]
MEILDQPTSPNDYTLASDGNRIIAFLIDGVISGVLSIIPIPFIGWILGMGYFLM